MGNANMLQEWMNNSIQEDTEPFQVPGASFEPLDAVKTLPVFQNALH